MGMKKLWRMIKQWVKEEKDEYVRVEMEILEARKKMIFIENPLWYEKGIYFCEGKMGKKEWYEEEKYQGKEGYVKHWIENEYLM